METDSGFPMESYLGMAIFAQPADTRPSPTLMGRILPDPIRNRVRYGFLKKKKKNPNQVQVGSEFYKKKKIWNPTQI